MKLACLGNNYVPENDLIQLPQCETRCINAPPCHVIPRFRPRTTLRHNIACVPRCHNRCQLSPINLHDGWAFNIYQVRTTHKKCFILSTSRFLWFSLFFASDHRLEICRDRQFNVRRVFPCGMVTSNFDTGVQVHSANLRSFFQAWLHQLVCCGDCLTVTHPVAVPRGQLLVIVTGMCGPREVLKPNSGVLALAVVELCEVCHWTLTATYVFVSVTRSEARRHSGSINDLQLQGSRGRPLLRFK